MSVMGIWICCSASVLYSPPVSGSAAGVIIRCPGARPQAESSNVIDSTNGAYTPVRMRFMAVPPNSGAWSLFIGLLPVSIRVGMNKAFDDRGADNPHIEPERPMPQVIQVMRDPPLHLFDAIGFAAKAV